MQQRIFQIFDILQHESHKILHSFFHWKIHLQPRTYHQQPYQFTCHFQTLLNNLENFLKDCICLHFLTQFDGAAILSMCARQSTASA